MCEWKNIRERVKKNEEKSQREPKKKNNKQNTMRKYHDPKSINSYNKRNHRKSIFFFSFIISLNFDDSLLNIFRNN